MEDCVVGLYELHRVVIQGCVLIQRKVRLSQTGCANHRPKIVA